MTHASLALTAQRLVRKHGRTVTLRRNSRTDTTAGKPWLGQSGAAQEVTAKVAFVQATEDEADGETVRVGDWLGLVASLDAGDDPSSFDEVVDGGAVRRIRRVLEARPGDVSILGTLVLEE